MDIVGAYAYGRLEKAKIEDTKVLIRNIQKAMVRSCTSNICACPKSPTELFRQGYLTKDPFDAWGQRLIYKCPGEHSVESADIVSKGKDKREGTGDDIKSWEL